MSPPQARKRLCVSLAYASLETNPASPEIYPEGGCILHHLLLCLAFQYSVPACGPFPMPADAPPWLPAKPYHASGPSLRYESGVQFGGLAVEWLQQPPLVLLQLGGTSPPLQAAPQGRQNVSSGLFHPFRPTGWQAGQPVDHVYLAEEVSSWEVWYLTSWMAGTSASGSSLGRPCRWPRQINLSASFHPDLVACTNIPWRMIGRCSPPTSHSGYSSRNISASIRCSASLTDIPPSFARSLVAQDFYHLLP